jgi:hypothetical protein
VNALNNSFLVPPPENTDENAYNFEIPPNKIPFKLHPTCEAEVYGIISKFAPKKSSGWDGISVHTLKYIALQIVEPLSYLINSSFVEGKFPRNMKIDKVIPVFKKGDTEDLNNYRPIVMTSSVSKVYEKIFRTYKARELASYC